MIKFNFDLLRKDIITKRSIDNRFTMREVSEQSGVLKSTLCRVENGKSFSIETLCLLCVWLDEEPSRYFEVTERCQDVIIFIA